MYSYGVDIHPTFQHTYQGGETWPVHFVIQKTGEGLADYTHPKHDYYAKWLAQKNSIPPGKVLGNYHYYRTGYNGTLQVALTIDTMNREGYDFSAFDFEAGRNDITDGEIMEYVEDMIYAETLTNNKILCYTNGWINEFIEYRCVKIWKGKYKEWYERQLKWLAGGNLYGTEAHEMPADDYDPFPNYNWLALQFYADHDNLGARTGFKDGDIDYNRMRVAPDKIHAYFGTGRSNDEPPPPPIGNVDLSTLQYELAEQWDYIKNNLEPGFQAKLDAFEGRIAALETSPPTPPTPEPPPAPVGERRISTDTQMGWRKHKYYESDKNPSGGRWEMLYQYKTAVMRILNRAKLKVGDVIYVIPEPKNTFMGGQVHALVVKCDKAPGLVGAYIQYWKTKG